MIVIGAIGMREPMSKPHKQASPKAGFKLHEFNVVEATPVECQNFFGNKFIEGDVEF